MLYNIYAHKGNLLNLASSMLKNGIERSSVYNEFLHFYNTYKMDDDLEDEIVDVLNILSGYHNPYVTVDGNGINIKITENICVQQT